MHGVLLPGARFGLTLEEGTPLGRAEQRTLGYDLAVWLIPGEAFAALAQAHQFHPVLQEDHTSRHAAVAGRLPDAYERDRTEIARRIGSALCERLIAEHRLCVRLLTAGRARKLAVVLEREA